MSFYEQTRIGQQDCRSAPQNRLIELTFLFNFFFFEPRQTVSLLHTGTVHNDPYLSAHTVPYPTYFKKASKAKWVTIDPTMPIAFPLMGDKGRYGPVFYCTPPPPPPQTCSHQPKLNYCRWIRIWMRTTGSGT